MRRIAFCAAMIIGLSGCATLQHTVTMPGLKRFRSDYVVDRSKPDDYPGFLAGEGNIYSCRYGIHYETPDEFHPPRAQMFAALLAKSLPGVTRHRVVLRRFDVYFNYRLAMLHVAGGAIGGIIGGAIAQSGDVNKNVFTFKKIILVTDPLQIRHNPKEHQVGCDNAHEGEYYASEITGGNDVIVTWLSFDVDGMPYQFESYYQFQPNGRGSVAAAIAEAIRMTIEGAATKVSLTAPAGSGRVSGGGPALRRR